MAAAKPPKAHARPAKRTVHLHRLDEILAARGVESTQRRQYRTQRRLIQANGPQQSQHGKGPKMTKERVDHVSAASRASVRASCCASVARESCRVASAGAIVDRGMRTRSKPVGNRSRVRRNASRK